MPPTSRRETQTHVDAVGNPPSRGSGAANGQAAAACENAPGAQGELGGGRTRAGDAQFLLRFYAVFAVAAAALLAPHLQGAAPYPSGLAVAGLLAGHHLAFLAVVPAAAARLRRQFEFAAVLSPFMVVPDLFLEAVLATLRFPDDGCPRLFGGRVSAYMAGMWTIPVLWILWAADGQHADSEAPRTPRSGPVLPGPGEAAAAAAVALAVFGAAEQLTFPLGLWHATAAVKHVRGHVALYVLPAEAVLGSAALVGHRLSCGAGLAGKAAAAAAVALLYTGALATSYLFVEELQVFGGPPPTG